MSEPKFSDTERVNALRHLCEKATKGPWEHFRMNPNIPICEGWIGRPDESVAMMARHGEGKETTQDLLNAKFIAHAREGVPYLLDLIDRYETMRSDALQIIVEFASGEYDSTGKCMADISHVLSGVFI